MARIWGLVAGIKNLEVEVESLLGSLYELGYYLKLSVTLGYLAPEETRELLPQVDRLGKMLNSLISSLRRDKCQ